jgi:hypothetical protein
MPAACIAVFLSVLPIALLSLVDWQRGVKQRVISRRDPF